MAILPTPPPSGDPIPPTALDAELTDAALRVLFANHPFIDLAEKALRSFGGDVDRATAERLLSSWVHRNALRDRERAALLARFPRTVTQ